MGAYYLYAVNEDGKSVSWTHNQKGHAALHIPDDEEVIIVLEHATVTTYIVLDPEGEFTIEQDE